MIPRTILYTLLLIGSALVSRAELRLHNLFTDHMVLQQGMSVPVWGWGDDGDKVTVEFAGKKDTVTVKNGQWMAKLKNLKPGPAGVLKITATRAGKNTVIQREDVVVGEVWLASGQSNMEWGMRSSFEPAEDIKNSANPNIRLFTVPKLKLNTPTNNVNGKWVECGPETVPGFSAVAYYFARDLQKALGVPVGIIHTSWGGSPAEVWMSDSVLSGDQEYQKDIVAKYTADLAKMEAQITNWEKQREAAKAEGKPFTARKPGPGWKPSELYNGMIVNLVPYAVQGAIWYQGESNAGRAWQYRRLFSDMIRNWRADWDQDFTFLEVQLASFDKGKKRTLDQITATPVDSDWAELREAQLMATKTLKKVGMAVITDVGDKDDIHPSKKQPVGSRLALLAREIAYGEKIVANGPEYRSVKFKDGQAVLSFKSVGAGLEARGGELTGFAIAGPDKKFVWATAKIEGDKVVVSSPSVPQPAAIRFGWSDFPVVNLWNKDGLPATPFRTDDWDMVTKPKSVAKK